MKKAGRGFHSDLGKELEYTSLPNRVDEELLDKRVTALRAGDMSQVQPICVSMLRFVMGLVTNFAHERRIDDLVGTALLALVESVTDAPNKLHDNNLMPYLTTSICFRLKDFIQGDHQIRMPGRTLRAFQAQGIEVKLAKNEADSSDAAFNCSEAYHRPAVARPEVPSLDFIEQIQNVIKSDIERDFVNIRAQNHTLIETAAMMNVSVGYVHGIKKRLARRFEEQETL